MKDFVKDFSFAIQYDDYSCGRVCLEMVMDNFDIDFYYRKFYALLKTNHKKGTNQTNIINVLKAFGFKTKVKSFAKKSSKVKDLEPLRDGWLGIACVDNNYHWIVLRGLGKRVVYVADPLNDLLNFHTLQGFKNRIKSGSIVYAKPRK